MIIKSNENIGSKIESDLFFHFDPKVFLKKKIILHIQATNQLLNQNCPYGNSIFFRSPNHVGHFLPQSLTYQLQLIFPACLNDLNTILTNLKKWFWAPPLNGLLLLFEVHTLGTNMSHTFQVLLWAFLLIGVTNLLPGRVVSVHTDYYSYDLCFVNWSSPIRNLLGSPDKNKMSANNYL